MELVVGGYAQGKLDHVLGRKASKPYALYKGVLPEDGGPREKIVVIDQLHVWIRERILQKGCPEEEVLSFVEECRDCIIICDETGNGIVPADAFEREYRERVGRILIELAGRAEKVERVICGISQRIK